MVQELPSHGVERFTNERIRFANSFTIGCATEVFSAGVYQVETKKVLAECAGHSAWIRRSTVLVIPTATGSYCREVRGCELDEAILRDKAGGKPCDPSENPDRGAAIPSGSLR